MVATALNTAFKEVSAKLPANNATLAQFKAWGTGMAKADQAFQTQVRSIAFPPPTASLMIVFLAQRAKVTDMFLKVAAATSVDQAITYYNDAAKLNDVALTMGAEIRRQLGLPPSH